MNSLAAREVQEEQKALGMQGAVHGWCHQISGEKLFNKVREPRRYPRGCLPQSLQLDGPVSLIHNKKKAWEKGRFQRKRSHYDVFYRCPGPHNVDNPVLYLDLPCWFIIRGTDPKYTGAHSTVLAPGKVRHAAWRSVLHIGRQRSSHITKQPRAIVIPCLELLFP